MLIRLAMGALNTTIRAAARPRDRKAMAMGTERLTQERVMGRGSESSCSAPTLRVSGRWMCRPCRDRP